MRTLCLNCGGFGVIRCALRIALTAKDAKIAKGAKEEKE